MVCSRFRQGSILSVLTALLFVAGGSSAQVSSAKDTVKLAPVSTYVRSQGERQRLAHELRRLATESLARASVPAERKALLRVVRAADLTLGNWPAVITNTQKIRALEPKPSMQQMEGLVFEAIARSTPQRGNWTQRFPTALSVATGRLDGFIVAPSLRSLRGQYFLMSANSTRSRIGARIGANIAAQAGTVDLGLAGDLLEQLFVLDMIIPRLDIIERVLSRRMARPDMKITDRWAQRQFQISDRVSRTEVLIGIWDSGVDTRAFGEAMWRNRRETENHVDDDGNGFVDDVNGFAFDLNRKASSGVLGTPPGGSSAELDRLALYSVGAGDIEAGEATQAARYARSVARSLSVEERADFELNLERFGLFTHGTGIASISVANNPAAKIMIGRFSYPIEQVQPIINEQDAAARIAYAYKAVAYFRANGARLVNMSFRLTLPNVEASLASVERDPERRRSRAIKIYNSLHEGFERALQSAPEILFLTSSGNSNENIDEVRNYPGGIRLDNLITVGAVDARLQSADISGFGRSVDVYALGVSVPQKLVGGRTIRYTGTSSATPQVTNLAGKLLAICPTLSVAALRAIIIETATEEGPRRARVVHPRAAVERIRSAACRQLKL